MKKVITESQLRQIVKESVRRVMNEISAELAGAAAIKASHIADSDNAISRPERARRRQQAYNLYNGAKRRFDSEHSYDWFTTNAEMPSAIGGSIDDDQLVTSYDAGDQAEMTRKYNPTNLTPDYSKIYRDTPYAEYSANSDSYYGSANRKNLRRMDKVEKDYDDLYQKSRNYKNKLNNNDQ